MISEKTLGAEIRRVRIALGLTQKELADRTNVTVNYISLLENGHRGVGITQLNKFAHALDVPSAFLVMLAETPGKGDKLLPEIQALIRAALPLLAS